MRRGRGSGFGKTILIGDQFVLRGVPALVAALPYATEATVEAWSGPGFRVRDERREVPGYKAKKRDQQTASVERILRVMGIDATAHPITITFGGDLLAGSGVGASAASCVSLARALDDAFELGLSIEEINGIGREGEFPYHGIPSGVDNTASTYGGLLLYRMVDGVASFERIEPPAPLQVVLANCGVTADTTQLDGYVLSLQQADPQLFERRMQHITEQALAMRTALESADLATVGRLMTDNHQLLIEMGLSHPRLVELCQQALEVGALGAKLTGGGRGGYMIALAPGPEVQDELARAFEAQGLAVIRATIGGG